MLQKQLEDICAKALAFLGMLDRRRVLSLRREGMYYTPDVSKTIAASVTATEAVVSRWWRLRLTLAVIGCTIVSSTLTAIAFYIRYHS